MDVLDDFDLTNMFREDAPFRVYHVTGMKLYQGDYNLDRINIVYHTTDKNDPHLRDFLYCNRNNPNAYDRAQQWYECVSDGHDMPDAVIDIINDRSLRAPKRVVCQPHPNPTKMKRDGTPIMSVVGYEF